jgi:hypothetical protein
MVYDGHKKAPVFAMAKRGLSLPEKLQQSLSQATLELAPTGGFDRR